MSDEDKVILYSSEGDDFNFLDERRRVELPVGELRRNLANFVKSLDEIMPKNDQGPTGLGLKTVSVAVGINSKGQVGFLGTGVEVGGTATLTLTFERLSS